MSGYYIYFRHKQMCTCTQIWTCTHLEHSSKTQNNLRLHEQVKLVFYSLIRYKFQVENMSVWESSLNSFMEKKAVETDDLWKRRSCPKQHSALIFGMEPVPLVAMCSPTPFIQTLLGGEVSEAVQIIRTVWIIQMSHIRLNIYMQYAMNHGNVCIHTL